MSYLGLDVGTSGCKAVVFDAGGRPLALARREYPVLTPREGWAELDSAEVCDHCFAVIRQAVEAAAADPVRAMCISSQGEAFTPVSAGGQVLRNAMVSSDSRATLLAESWSASFGRQELYRITGHTAHPMFTLFKLLWLKENEPHIWSAVRQFLCFEDLLHQRLGLEPAMSWPLAGRTMLFNVRTHAWDDGILDAVGLRRDQLSRPLASGEIVGRIPPAVARPLALPDGVLVVAGGHDQTCAALGAGVTREGRAMYATGTVECLCPAFAAPRFSDELFKSNLCTYNFTLPEMFTTVAFSLTGGNLLQWFRDQWGRQEMAAARAAGTDAYTLLLAQLPAEPTNLLVLPYFTPSGTPYFDARTPGAILGLRLTTRREQVLRALLEGVALEMRLNIEILDRAGIRIDQLIASGGGARSRALTQLKADVLNKPITVLPVTETGCLGAALLAQAADCGVSPRTLADQRVQPCDQVEPDPARAACYQERFARYQELYPLLRGLSI
jgi:xylulokinase